MAFYLRTVTRVGFCTLDTMDELTVRLPDEVSILPLRLAPAMAV